MSRRLHLAALLLATIAAASGLRVPVGTRARLRPTLTAVSLRQQQQQQRQLLSEPPAQPPQFDVNIEERTRSCLDFDVVLRALRDSTVTVLGKSICNERGTSDVAEGTLRYAMVEQMFAALEYFPLRNNMDVEPLLRMIELNSSPPERSDLAKFSENIEQVTELLTYFEENGERLPLLLPLSARMALPTELLGVFVNSFDDEDNLNAEKYPEIMRLRREIGTLKTRILQIIQSLLKAQDMKDKLADSGYTEVEGRFCLMLKNTYKKGVGIVHGSSNTGRTFYVEPMEVVDLTNDMKGLQGQLRAEENRILFEMCRSVSAHLGEIRASVMAVAEIDVIRAKAKLGRKIGGVIPELGGEGTIRCLDAKHPVLLLRGTQPVGNNIDLSRDATALVISGPNAGGKTIVLKTAGLFALMALHALPVPAKAGARVDVFEVMADIGDMQSVSGDLSTFSGHLVVCRNILAQARAAKEERGLDSLVLFDEIGTGTDPVQGAALAQAVLEELLALGSRVVVTTHYQRIKELAAENPRFQVAAMEFVDNRPTYRLRLGSVGESFALEAGRRMRLPESVLTRAHALMDDESRRIVALQQRLEEETERARLRQAELDELIAGLDAREAAVGRSEVEAEALLGKIREGRTDEFLGALRDKERELAALMRKAQEAVLAASAPAANPSSASASASASDAPAALSKAEREKAVEESISAVRALRTATEKEQVEATAESLANPLVSGEPVEEGTTLVVLERGSIFGSRGVVTQRNKGRGRVCLRVAGVEIKMERHLLGVPKVSGRLGFAAAALGGDGGEAGLSAKEKRLLKMLQEELVDPGKLSGGRGSKSSSGSISASASGADGQQQARRNAANTVSVTTALEQRGLEAAQGIISTFIERAVEGREGSVVYVQHGAGAATASARDRLRAWLKKHPLVEKAAAAPLSEGGDAFTLVRLIDD